MIKIRPMMVARAVVDGCQSTIEDFNRRIIKQETGMTERLFGSVATSLNGRSIGNLTWKAYSLTSGRGKAAEETRHGADVLGVLDIDLQDYKTKKGFLAQAKIAEPFMPMSKGEWERFREQCKLMVERTPDAFAVIYSREKDIRFIPAATILEIGRDQLFEVGHRSLFGFFKSHVKCEIGDRRLDAPGVEVLERLLRTRERLSDFMKAETVLSMKVTDAPNP